jgi:biotin operon repressor
MNIPVELIAACLAVALTAVLGSQRAIWKRIARLEKNVLTIIIMLRDRGMKIPSESDTERLLKSDL